MSKSAYFYAIIGKCSVGVMQAVVKYVDNTLSPFQILLIRSLCIFLLTWYLVRKAELSPYIRSKSRTLVLPLVFILLLLRMASMNLAVILMFHSLNYLPVSTASTLYNLSPIFIFFIEAAYYRVDLSIILAATQQDRSIDGSV
jgi:drug/metabolite transporter (DMT)-like permease